MGKGTRFFKSEAPKKRVEVGEFLHQIADRSAYSEVVLRQGTEELALQIPEHLILKVQVE